MSTTIDIILTIDVADATDVADLTDDLSKVVEGFPESIGAPVSRMIVQPRPATESSLEPVAWAPIEGFCEACDGILFTHKGKWHHDDPDSTCTTATPAHVEVDEQGEDEGPEAGPLSEPSKAEARKPAGQHSCQHPFHDVLPPAKVGGPVAPPQYDQCLGRARPRAR